MVSSLDREVVILGMRMIKKDFLKWFKNELYTSSCFGFTYSEVVRLFENLDTLEIYPSYIQFVGWTYVVARLRSSFIDMIKAYENQRNASQ